MERDMLTKEDLRLIRGVVSDEMSQTENHLDKHFAKNLIEQIVPLEKRLKNNLTAEIAPLEKRLKSNLVAEIAPLEKRLINNMATEMSSLEKRMTKNVVSEVVPKVVSEVVPKVVSEVVPKVVSEVTLIVGEMIENNIIPQFDEVWVQFNEVRKDIRFIKAQMVTRFDLEDRLADFKLSFKGSVL